MFREAHKRGEGEGGGNRMLAQELHKSFFFFSVH
jgi:hypothetical protein